MIITYRFMTSMIINLDCDYIFKDWYEAYIFAFDLTLLSSLWIVLY